MRSEKVDAFFQWKRRADAATSDLLLKFDCILILRNDIWSRKNGQVPLWFYKKGRYEAVFYNFFFFFFNYKTSWLLRPNPASLILFFYFFEAREVFIIWIAGDRKLLLLLSSFYLSPFFWFSLKLGRSLVYFYTCIRVCAFHLIKRQLINIYSVGI